MTNTTHKTIAKSAAISANKAGKALTKAERLRVNLAKANASATKKLTADVVEGDLISNLVNATKNADGAARVMAFYMNEQFAEPMAAFRCHWSALTSANCRSDNEKAVLARINELRKTTQDAATTKGLANVNRPWSDMKRISSELFHGNGAREKSAPPLDARQKTDLTRLYKAGMKEERPTETECDLNIAIGELLVTYFKVDLSTLG
jgi:hypothetical protein